MVLTFLLSACLHGGGTGLDGDSATILRSEYATAWIGDYFGGGAGLVDGLAFSVDEARLRVTLDADSVKRGSCPFCVTVALDSVFSQVNVVLTDPAELTLSYDDGPVRHTLIIRRESARGEVGNAISARATLAHAGVQTPFFDVTYLLARP